ncbi:MAG: hypothetical protein PHC97_03965 [Patescibacteria group bacterium]|nr:hypothetical protein [Patescibacteria group bacterium]
MKKFFLSSILILAILFLFGCAPKVIDQTQISGNNTAITSGKCAPGSVDLANYGDKGKRLANCFVEYPGEPSRPDKSYYIVEDICGQFTKEFMEPILGKKIVKVVPSPVATLYNCSYYYDENNYVMLVMDYLNVANQKKGREFIGHKIMVDPRIPMENFYAVQENGLINTVYLVLGPDKFISIERTSAEVLPGDEVLQFAARLANEIKNYK